MTIKDLTNNIEIQGNIIVKQWDDVKETYIILVETDEAIFNKKVLDMEAQFIYAIDGILIIEV